MSLSNESTMVMPVAPAYQGGYGYGNGCGSMWGGDWASWIILFLIFGMFGWGGFGNFGGGFGGGNGLGSPSGQGWATRADINEGFALNNLQSGINSIQNGICDSTYTLTNAINNGFHGVDTAMCNLGTQLQQHCCDNARAIDGVNYNMATQAANIQNSIQGVRYDMATQAGDTRNTIQNSTRDIIDNANANARAVLDALSQNYIRSLENENQSLKLAASQSNQNAVLMAAMDANKAEILRRTGAECPTPAYVVQPPQPVTFPNFCGCNSGCGSCA